MRPSTLFIIGSLLILAALLSGCAGARPLEQPTRSVPFSKVPPKDAAEWARLTRELDDARADNQRKDEQVRAVIDERNSANANTWKRFGFYSFLFMVPGVLILVGSFLPWTMFLQAARPAAAMLIGLGFVCGLMPHLIAQYGSYAFIPAASVAGLWVIAIAMLDIWGRIKRARTEAKIAVAVLDPTKPQEAGDLVDVKKNDPMFAAALKVAAKEAADDKAIPTADSATAFHVDVLGSGPT